MVIKAKKNLEYICEELGLVPQFLYELSAVSSGMYKVFDIPKKTGGSRTICVPEERLKGVQRILLDNVISRIGMPEHVHGAVKGRSIATNALGHVGKPLVINIDLTDFFGSIKRKTVYGVFKDVLKFDSKSAEVLTNLTVHGDSLPQGAPTSPALANLAALSLDQELIEICRNKVRNYQFDYTRYIDDITISGDSDLARLVPLFHRAIKKHGFKANPKKLKYARRNSCQKVTGVVVNEKINAPRKLIRKVRQKLHYCEKFGMLDHCLKSEIGVDEFLRELRGLISYIRVSRPELADLFEVHLNKLLRLAMEGERELVDHKLLFLRAAIGNEKTVTFVYNDNSVRVVPVKLELDSSGYWTLRAFQLQPEEKWRTFILTYIESVNMPGH